jgi:hypothetical protein
MKLKRFAIVLWCIALTVLAVGAAKKTMLIDNFNDGDSEGWAETDFTGGLGVFDASSGSYLLELTAPISVNDPSVGALDADWEPGESQPRFANGTIRGKVRANTFGTTIGFLMRDDHETESDYGFYGSTSFGTFYIERFELFAHPEAPQTILAMADPDDFPFEVGVDYWIEGSVVGQNLEMRAWRVGCPRPARPMLKLKDNVLPPKPGTTIATIALFDPVPLIEAGVEEVQISATVDDITFTPGKAR